MKAPDKIYTDNRGVYAELPIFSQAGANVEYICKSALLEWAEELRENARASRENPTSIEFDRYMEGKEKTISKFIDKLNSL